MVGRDIALYMHRLGFKPYIFHIFTLKTEFLATPQLDIKKNFHFLIYYILTFYDIFFSPLKKPFFFCF